MCENLQITPARREQNMYLKISESVRGPCYIRAMGKSVNKFVCDARESKISKVMLFGRMFTFCNVILKMISFINAKLNSKFDFSPAFVGNAISCTISNETIL